MARRVSALLQRNPNQTYFFAFGAGEWDSDTSCTMLQVNYKSICSSAANHGVLTQITVLHFWIHFDCNSEGVFGCNSPVSANVLLWETISSISCLKANLEKKQDNTNNVQWFPYLRHENLCLHTHARTQIAAGWGTSSFVQTHRERECSEEESWHSVLITPTRSHQHGATLSWCTDIRLL